MRKDFLLNSKIWALLLVVCLIYNLLLYALRGEPFQTAGILVDTSMLGAYAGLPLVAVFCSKRMEGAAGRNVLSTERRRGNAAVKAEMYRCLRFGFVYAGFANSFLLFTGAFRGHLETVLVGFGLLTMSIVLTVINHVLAER